MGIILNALLMTVFCRKHPRPALLTRRIASAIVEHVCVQEQCYRFSIALLETINDESVGNRRAPFWGSDQEAKHRKTEMAEL